MINLIFRKQKIMLHNAIGSMPQQPEKDPNTEEIITPVEGEKEMVEPTSDVPSEETAPEIPESAPEEANEPEAQNDTNEEPDSTDGAPVAPEAPIEGEMDPSGEEPVVEPINE